MLLTKDILLWITGKKRNNVIMIELISKHFRMTKLKTITTFFVICCLFAKAQNPAYFSMPWQSLQGVNLYPQPSTGATPNVSTNNITFSVVDKKRSPQSQPLIEKNISADLSVKLDLGDDYISIGENPDFKAKVSFNIISEKINLIKTITISSSSPEAMQVIDLLSYFPNVSYITITNISATITDSHGAELTSGSTLRNYLENNIRLSAKFERKFNVDIRFKIGR